MMKKNIYLKLFSILLCLVFLFGISALVTSARAAEYTPMEWELDEDLTYLYGGNKRYDRYYVRGAFYGDAKTEFCFMNEVFYDGAYRQIYGESAYPHIVSVVTSPGYSTIFVDAEGKAILDAFLDRSDCIYYLELFEYYDVSYTTITEEDAYALDAAYRSAPLERVDVAELGEADIFEITVHDRTETKAYQHGAVYVMPNGSYYYVCFEDLDNSYFDADGYFSYRAGSVGAYELDDEECLAIDAAIAAMTSKEYDIIYEDYVVEGYYDVNGNPIDPTLRYGGSSDELTSIILFFVISAIFGIVVPGALLALGLILANSKKTGKAKCWYSLSAAAALWMLSAMLFMLLVAL